MVRLWATVSRLACLGTLMIAAGCATNEDRLQLADLLGEWQVTSLQGEPPPQLPRPATLIIDDQGNVGGSGGINQFRARLDTAALAEGRLVITPGPTTLAAGPPEAMAFERRYLQTLGVVDDYARRNGTLYLFANEQPVMVLSAGGMAVDS
ncbi:MAG: META domain-containing protein [Pseudomonadota bacterium]